MSAVDDLLARAAEPGPLNRHKLILLIGDLANALQTLRLPVQYHADEHACVGCQQALACIPPSPPPAALPDGVKGIDGPWQVPTETVEP